MSRASSATLMEPLLIDCGPDSAVNSTLMPQPAVTVPQCLARGSLVMSPMSIAGIKTIHAACRPCSSLVIDHRSDGIDIGDIAAARSARMFPRGCQKLNMPVRGDTAAIAGRQPNPEITRRSRYEAVF